MAILVAGPAQSDNLAGTAYQRVVHGSLGGRPTRIDGDQGGRSIELAIRIANAIPGAVLHDVSQGGALIAIAELLVVAGIGAHIEMGSVAEAFGEDPHRFLCLIPANRRTAVGQLAREEQCEVREIGITGGHRLTIASQTTTHVSLEQITQAWRDAIAGKMHGAVHE